LSILTKFFGRTASEGAAFALGTAVGPALSPAVREIVNEAWSRYPTHPLDPAALAEIVAEDVELLQWGRDQAAESGIASGRFDALTEAVRNAPGVSELFALWRRDLIDGAAFEHGLRKARLEPRWIAPLRELKNVLLSPADLAMMRQQGFIERARQIEESAKQGVDAERADLLFEISGLPPGVAQGLELWRRDIIDRQTFDEIVREGHTKTKYTAALEVLKRVLLSPATVVNLFLRGWIDRPEYHSRMAKWGYDAADADDWYDASGRPAAPVQMFNAWARGVDGPDNVPMNKAQFLKGIRESDIRPEWGEMLWGIRHAYPSLFQLRNAVQSGAISRARALTILGYERYEDQDATAMVDTWLRQGGTTSKGLTVSDLANEYEARWLTRAQYIAELRQLGYSADNAAAKADAEDSRRARAARNRRVELIGQRYVKHALSRDQAVAELTASEVPARVRDSLMPEWDAMRSITPDALTSPQIKKAFARAQITRAEAVTRLMAKGYEEASANIYLDE
jgi:hypothetical protein